VVALGVVADGHEDRDLEIVDDPNAAIVARRWVERTGAPYRERRCAAADDEDASDGQC
jgi:hypothetical protein